MSDPEQNKQRREISNVMNYQYIVMNCHQQKSTYNKHKRGTFFEIMPFFVSIDCIWLFYVFLNDDTREFARIPSCRSILTKSDESNPCTQYSDSYPNQPKSNHNFFYASDT